MPKKAVLGFLKISRAIDQLALSGKRVMGETLFFGRSKLMSIMAAEMAKTEMKNKKILVLEFDSRKV